jgi:lysophospholipase L1-like esterase
LSVPSNSAAVNALLAASSNTGNVPLVTYNWNPSSQLSNYLQAQAKVAAGVADTAAKIVAVGDSTTLGFGGSANDYRPTVSYPSDLAVFLSQDGVAAQADNFLGQGNNDFTVPDSRVSLVGGAIWGYPFVAGGPVVVTNGAGQGVSFTLSQPEAYDTLTVNYIDMGNGKLNVSANGGPTVATLQLGNTGKMMSQTISLPLASYSQVSVTSTSTSQADIEGVSFSNSKTPSVQVFNAGVGGAQSSVVGDGVSATAGIITGAAALGANLALINFGINDILQGTLSAAQTTANIGLMVAEFRASGTDPVIIIPQPLAAANYTAEIATLRADIYHLADTMNVPVIDLSATYGDNASSMLSAGLLGNDGVHPTATLYADVASGIARLLTGASAAVSSAPATVTAPVVTAPVVTAPVVTAPVVTPPAVTLVTAPSVQNGGVSVVGSAAASSGHSLTAALISDAMFPSGSSIAINNENILYTPASFNAAQAAGDSISYKVIDSVTGAITTETQTITLVAPKPTVVLATSPSVTSGDTVIIGSATAGDSSALSVALTSDSLISAGSSLTISNGNIVYAPGVFANAQAASDSINYNVTNSTTGATTAETQTVNLTASPPIVSPPVVSTMPSAQTIGSGPDSFVLNLSEDAYLGNAQFTVSVDGTQIGGVQTATALHSLGQEQALTVSGSFGTAAHTVTVDFLNDAYAGSADTDRNLYVDTISTSGGVQNTHAALLGAGPQSFSIGSTTTSSASTTPSSTVTVGSGPDILALQISEDAYAGDAQFTIAVNGTQIGGVQTATASHSAGASQTFNVMGTFAGPSTASITFLNDAYGGTVDTDRNLYETSATINGQTINGSALTEMSGGPMAFMFHGSVATDTSTSPVVLNLAEDAYKGDAQFTVSIDGGAASAPQYVSALHSAGASEAFSLGNLATGSHDIAVSFVNDLYDGTASTDRNLYVTGINVNGNASTNSTASILGDWTTHFTVSVPSHQ